jgi:hypothetical protein
MLDVSARRVICILPANKLEAVFAKSFSPCVWLPRLAVKKHTPKHFEAVTWTFNQNVG